MVNADQQNYKEYIFTLSCPDRLGVLAQVSSLLFDAGAFITETAQYSDPYSERFFSRMVFDDRQLNGGFSELESRITELGSKLELNYRLRELAYRPRVLLAVSKYDHCLNVLLTKWRSGALPVEIVGVVSNHEDCRGMVEWYGIPYHYLPVTAASKSQQEAQMLALMESERVELLVLARYMQILSDELCARLQGRAINIHHSFLPGFKGAKPYHQAHARGVKIIGATAHYVTADLDEGPIIVQEVRHVDHSHTPERMVHMGHDIEASTLSRAVLLHTEERVVLNGSRTVILE